ncbi:uncharacterized protein BT62DRAFT_992006 [Guyanagaster necrorhizus]|uniref:Uncharacterized protein n=1 Tax=Guyanagaster necrorhizus TaxID=856835 RepID=A0A9P7VZS9_9AGAR|nr:uncharacterized protein BT62DRAFT_992006 [Guyanagaster necrorhizus MCA 3950]KAG7449964.1 hypothetical protein BT62DRAFT_992006 [Guyanagaster necrorhizus MCA 3950]
MIPSPTSSATLINPEPCHYKKLDFSVAIEPKGHLEPHVSNLPRRRVAKRRAVVDESESSNDGSAKTHPACSPRPGGEHQRPSACIQALGEGTDVYVALGDIEDWDGVVIRVEDEGQNDRGVPTLSRSTFFVTVSGKVLVVGRVNAFAVALGILCRRSRRDVIKTYMELHDTGGLDDSWRGLLSREGLEWVIGQQE